jgi:DNA-binding NarL/FixJ family response regulator
VTKTKLLLVEDHIVVRQGLKALLSDEPDLIIVGEASNGREALQRVQELAPDIVLMDISMPTLNGIEATRQICKSFPKSKVIILSMHANEEYVFQVLRAGAVGYVLKQADSSQVSLAIEAALTGGVFLSPPISRTVVDDYIKRAEIRERHHQYDLLTPREREVLQLLAEGIPNRTIAKQLGISIKTVESHRSNMLVKLELHDKTELIRFALRQGLTSLEK